MSRLSQAGRFSYTRAVSILLTTLFRHNSRFIYHETSFPSTLHRKYVYYYTPSSSVFIYREMSTLLDYLLALTCLPSPLSPYVFLRATTLPLFHYHAFIRWFPLLLSFAFSLAFLSYLCILFVLFSVSLALSLVSIWFCHYFFPFSRSFLCIPFSSFLRFVFLVFLLSNSHHYIFSPVSYVYTFLYLLCIMPSPSHRILFLSFFSPPSLCNVLKSLSLFFLNLTQFFHFFVPSTSSPLPLYLSVFISIFSPLYSSFHLPLPPHISLSSSFSPFPSPFSIFSPLSSSPLFSLLHFPSLSFREYLPASTHLRCH